MSFYQKGLQNLTKIKSGETKKAYIKNELVNTDLEFNINTLLSDLSTNSDSIAITLEELNNYLTKSREYRVTLKVDTDLPLKIDTLAGSVKVINTESLEVPSTLPENCGTDPFGNPIPCTGTSSSASSNTSTENCGTDPFGNPIPCQQ